MKQVADDVFRLGSRGHNFYIIKDGANATIVDSGASREWGKLAEGLDALDLSMESVAGLIITHVHSDHFGLARRIDEAGVVVSVHDDEQTRALGRYTGRFSVKAHELPMFSMKALRNFVPMILAGVLKLDFVDSVATFADGATLDLPGYPNVIHTPGHTEGHAMFHCADKGILFTGDGLVTMDLLGSDTGPQMLEKRFHVDEAQAFRSLDRMRDLDAELLLPGHGEPWSGTPAEALGVLPN